MLHCRSMMNDKLWFGESTEFNDGELSETTVAIIMSNELEKYIKQRTNLENILNNKTHTQTTVTSFRRGKLIPLIPEDSNS